ncbi:hypothetical protein Tco_0893278 [Tanacetum coccineum]|uniref:Uncharacterized protein n=1 Tax=Tanacetum coccineum TaxID=301880 RepID=A0ABQ5CBJ7_9ASTR
MSTSDEETLVESGAFDRTLILEKESYVPWASRFIRFLDNRQEKGERMRLSIEIGPYARKMISDPDNPTIEIPEPISKMTEVNKKQYVADIKTRQNYKLKDVDYDVLFDTLSQFEQHVNASKAKKSARNHDPLALVAHLNVHSSQSHASPSFSHSPQSYYVTRPSSVIDYEEDYQGELQGDSQEDKLTTAMMLLARAITQHFSTPTNNQLCTSSNTRNQAVIQDGRVDIQSKNVSYAGNGNMNAGRQNRNQAANAENGLVQQIEENDQIV